MVLGKAVSDLEKRALYQVKPRIRKPASSTGVRIEKCASSTIGIESPGSSTVGGGDGQALAHGAGDFRVERCAVTGGEEGDPGANAAVGAAAGDGAVAGRRLVFSNRLPAGARPDATRVFDRFYQGDASRSGGGAGLGLSVVQNLCAQMGATATATVTEECFELAIDFR